MMRIRTLIVDDEALAREGIRVLLADDPEVQVIGECSNGNEALRAIRELNPDLVFLDVQMPELSGFEVLANLGDAPMPAVVFVTAYDQYALRAFDVHALDYLLKPFKDQRFREAVTRAKAKILQEKAGEASDKLLGLLKDIQSHGEIADPPKTAAQEAYLSRLVVKSGGRVLFVGVQEIDWIEAADYYVKLHVGPTTHLVRTTLAKLEGRLDPAHFQRIHRSTIVNLDRVASLEPYFHGDFVVRLLDESELRLSRRYRQRLEMALGQAL